MFLIVPSKLCFEPEEVYLLLLTWPARWTMALKRSPHLKKWCWRVLKRRWEWEHVNSELHLKVEWKLADIESRGRGWSLNMEITAHVLHLRRRTLVTSAFFLLFSVFPPCSPLLLFPLILLSFFISSASSRCLPSLFLFLRFLSLSLPPRGLL